MLAHVYNLNVYSGIFPYQHLSVKYPHMLLRLFHVSPSVVLLFLLFLPPKPFFGRSNMVKCLRKESNIFCHVMLPTHSCWLTLDKNSSFTLSDPNKNYETKTSLCWMQVVEHGCRNQKLLPWCIFYPFTCFSSVFLQYSVGGWHFHQTSTSLWSGDPGKKEHSKKFWKTF